MNKKLAESQDRMQKCMITLEEKFAEYTKALQNARKATEEFGLCLEEVCSQPQIVILDCEIDS